MKKYIFEADLVRTVAIIGAIGVHLVIPITARPDFFGGTIWWLTFLLNCLFRISVPLFVILSGYLSLRTPRTLQNNFNKVIHRLLIPLVSYYLIFTIAYATMAYLRREPYDYWGIFHNLSKNTHSSLYFLVILFFIQLLNPLWSLLTEEKNRLILKYVCRFFFILGAVANFFYYLSLREGEVFSTYTYWMMWLGYYLFGVQMSFKPPTLNHVEVRKYLTMFTGGYLVTVVAGYVMLYLYHHQINDLFYIGGQTYADSYLSVSVMLMSVSAFNLIMRSGLGKWFEMKSWLKKSTQFIAGLAFAMYLNHLLVMDTLSKFYGVTPDSPSMPGLWGYFAIEVVTAFALTVPLSYVLKSLPIVRKIVGEQ